MNAETYIRVYIAYICFRFLFLSSFVLDSLIWIRLLDYAMNAHSTKLHVCMGVLWLLYAFLFVCHLSRFSGINLGDRCSNGISFIKQLRLSIQNNISNKMKFLIAFAALVAVAYATEEDTSAVLTKSVSDVNPDGSYHYQ